MEQKIKQFHWERWLQRPPGAFMFSLFQESITRTMMRHAGVDAEYIAAISQDGVWYKSSEVHKRFRTGIEKYLKKGGSIFRVSHSCEKLWHDKKRRILKMITEPHDHLINNLVEFKHIVNQVNAYVWLTYGFEEIYTDRLRREVPRYIKTDIDEFIREASLPVKKNAHAQLEAALGGGGPLQHIQEEFGWIKSRDGFSRGFTVPELRVLRKKIKQVKKPTSTKIKIPAGLRPLMQEVQELTYFRTLRGDARSNLIFLMRPLLVLIAQKYNIPFQALKYYAIDDLVSGTPKLYPASGTFLFYRGEMVFSKNRIVLEESVYHTTVKGTVGFRGIIKGKVKIVTHTKHLGKVHEGDILVAQMTFPAFITAMHRAAAFVTDEGGITCHAAIIAREMKKPCVIGTKMATKVFHDGDMVEVDADRGVVKKV